MADTAKDDIAEAAAPEAPVDDLSSDKEESAVKSNSREEVSKTVDEESGSFSKGQADGKDAGDGNEKGVDEKIPASEVVVADTGEKVKEDIEEFGGRGNGAPTATSSDTEHDAPKQESEEATTETTEKQEATSAAGKEVEERKDAIEQDRPDPVTKDRGVSVPAIETASESKEPKDEGAAAESTDTVNTVNAPPGEEKAIESTSLAAVSHEEQVSSEEVSAVARAFGVSASISERDSAQEQASGSSIDKERSSAAPLANTNSTPSSSRTGGIRIGKGPPPTGIASEEKPFDFNRFLDQMRHKSAGPVGEYVRSFIKGFTMKPYRAADQTKLIFDFLDFIAVRMRECEVWKGCSDVEFENATEAMEKLVMNRLYNYTFSPAIRREGKWSVQTDDLERDRVLKQRIKLFGWIEEKHLDVPTGDHSHGFIEFAIQELSKINHYKAPRDKVICILNCCKVIFGLIRHLSSEENADTFIPILIFVVLRANPDHLISNVEYISRFRNPDKLSSESGYYLSSLMGAIAFIETMDYTSLSNITQQEFEKKVEDAVASMGAQANPSEGQAESLGPARQVAGAGMRTPSPAPQMANAEESARVLPVSAGATALAEDTRAFFQRTGKAAKAGFGASLGGPMTALGRLFQEGIEGQRTPSGASPMGTSGHATPESPSPAHALQAGAPTARSRMWNLFGTDAGEDGRSPQQAQQHGMHSYPARVRTQSGGRAASASTTPLNLGSWGRSMRADPESEPPTPQSEELQQGRFATLEGLRPGSGQKSNLTGGTTNEHGLPAAGLPRRPAQPMRQGSLDPYSYQDDDGGEGVRTPTDDGSEADPQSPATAGALRSRLGDLSGLLPSFLSDQRLAQQEHPQPRVDRQGGSAVGDHVAAPLNEEEARQAAAQIERAHLDAGVDTLKSIFPHTEQSVCRLVLEGCDGNVQAAIDKLLEMS